MRIAIIALLLWSLSSAAACSSKKKKFDSCELAMADLDRLADKLKPAIVKDTKSRIELMQEADEEDAVEAEMQCTHISQTLLEVEQRLEHQAKLDRLNGELAANGAADGAPGHPLVGLMETFADDACACKTDACLKALANKLAKDAQAAPMQTERSEADNKRIEAASKRVTACMDGVPH